MREIKIWMSPNSYNIFHEAMKEQFNKLYKMKNKQIIYTDLERKGLDNKFKGTSIIKRVARGKNIGQFRFIIKARNGEIIADSRETYTQKHNVISLLEEHFSDYQIKDLTI